MTPTGEERCHLERGDRRRWPTRVTNAMGTAGPGGCRRYVGLIDSLAPLGAQAPGLLEPLGLDPACADVIRLPGAAM
jgi:hypothetical protein